VKLGIIILWSLVFSLSLAACDPRPQPSPPPPTTPAATDDPGLNLLIVAEGNVHLKRIVWPAYHPTAFGAVLHRGDLLQVADDAKVTILCDGLTLWTPPTGAPAGLTNGCPQPSDKLLASGAIGIASANRGGSDPLLPYIISPRQTRLLTPTPTLRWNGVPGATGYTVRVSGGEVKWQVEVDPAGVDSTEIGNIELVSLIYPGPSLQPGVTYLLTVEADTGASSQAEDVVGLGFTRLNETEAPRVQAAAEKLAGLKLSHEAQAFALAQLYAGRNLTAEAIETLEALASNGSQAAAVYLTLGDLYRKISLTRLAETRYLMAVELAVAAGDVEGQAAAQAGLGEVYAAIGNFDEATRWLHQAQAEYEALGDSQNASELAERAMELQKP
jgi:hypothetical protein